MVWMVEPWLVCTRIELAKLDISSIDWMMHENEVCEVVKNIYDLSFDHQKRDHSHICIKWRLRARIPDREYACMMIGSCLHA